MEKTKKVKNNPIGDGKGGEGFIGFAPPPLSLINERLTSIESAIKMLADTMCVNQAIWKAMLRELMVANHKVGSADLLP